MEFYFSVLSLKVTAHGNPDNNLESPYIFYETKTIIEVWLMYEQNNSFR
jgi:hypothetical protein